MADPTAADERPHEEWDPLQAEYEDLRAQERQRNQQHYAVRKARRQARKLDAEIDQLERDIHAALADDPG